MAVGKINLQKYSSDDTATKEIEKSVWLNEIQKIKDENISSHIQRKINKGTANWFDKKLCCLLNKFESNHCKKSLGE